jgi:hypothetical protein
MARQNTNNAIGAENFVTSNWIGWKPKVDDVCWHKAPLKGSWRYVLECANQISGDEYVIKIAKKMPLDYLLELKPNGFLWWLIRCDENSRERRALTKLHKHPEFRNHFPALISRGNVNGHSAIVVSKSSLSSEITPIESYVEEYKFDDALRSQLEKLCAVMCDNHILCNDISLSNVVVSDKSGTIVPVVIDGFGNNHLIPYPVISKRLNAVKLNRRFGRMFKRLSELEQKSLS